MYKRNKDSTGADTETIGATGLKDGTKIMLIGSTSEEVTAVKALKNEGTFDRKIKITAKAYSTPKKSYFSRIQALSGYPNQTKAQQLLERIATDHGITSVMEKHGWKVGLLREMSIEERPNHLGYNMNKGVEIALRLRFDDGFRSYQSLIDVMLHELTHMEISPHDNTFYALYRQLHKEVALSSGKALGGHDINPNSPEEAEYEIDDVMTETAKSSGQKLGGNSNAQNSKSMRDLILSATMQRITEEEMKISDACANNKSDAHSSPKETNKT